MAKPPKTESPEGPRKRRGLTRPVGAYTAALTKTAIGRRGFAAASIVTDWLGIVGPDYAAACQPDRLVFPKGKRVDGTLHLRVTGAAALAIQHLTHVLIERVNAHFGYGAVAHIRLIQAPLRAQAVGKRSDKPRIALPEADRAALHGTLEAVENEALRDTLARLGEAVLRRDLAAKSDKDR